MDREALVTPLADVFKRIGEAIMRGFATIGRALKRLPGWTKATFIGAALAVGAAWALIKRLQRVQPSPAPSKARIEAERDAERAEVLDEQADALAPAVESEQAAIETSQARVEAIKPLDVAASDEEVAAAFTDAGLGKRRVP